MFTHQNTHNMQSDRIVLDTNSLLVSISRRGSAYPVWRGFQNGEYTLCVTNEILAEYEEVIARNTNIQVARNVVDYIVQSKNVEFIDPFFKLHLITADPDDNKFVDCAFAAGATFIVSDDTHYDVLKENPFPQILVLRLKAFVERLSGK